MEQILKTLQEVQLEALKKGVHSFHLDLARNDAGNFVIGAYVRLREDNPDEDYLYELFFANTTNSEYKIERIKAFINSLN